MPTSCQSPVAPAETDHCRAHTPPPPQAFELTLSLEGITSDDYLQWIRDPDPPNHLGLELIAVNAFPLGNHIRLTLMSANHRPPARGAAHAVGFPITPEVVRVQSRPIPPRTSVG